MEILKYCQRSLAECLHARFRQRNTTTFLAHLGLESITYDAQAYIKIQMDLKLRAVVTPEPVEMAGFQAISQNLLEDKGLRCPQSRMSRDLEVNYSIHFESKK